MLLFLRRIFHPSRDVFVVSQQHPDVGSNLDDIPLKGTGTLHALSSRVLSTNRLSKLPIGARL